MFEDFYGVLLGIGLFPSRVLDVMPFSLIILSALVFLFMGALFYFGETKEFKKLLWRLGLKKFSQKFGKKCGRICLLGLSALVCIVFAFMLAVCALGFFNLLVAFFSLVSFLSLSLAMNDAIVVGTLCTLAASAFFLKRMFREFD